MCPLLKPLVIPIYPATAARAEVFAFIETELKESLPNLSETTGALTYGRPNKFVALALLTKLYLNAEYYIGKPMYTEAVAMADGILSKNKYTLTSPIIFRCLRPDNGPGYSGNNFCGSVRCQPNKRQPVYPLRHALRSAAKIPDTFYAQQQFNDLAGIF